MRSATGLSVLMLVLAPACGGDSDGGSSTGGQGGGAAAGGSSGSGGSGAAAGSGGSAGSSTGGAAGSNTGGAAGSSTGGAAGSSTGGAAGSNTGGAAGSSTGGVGGKPGTGGVGGKPGTGGVGGISGSGGVGGKPGTGGVGGTGGSGGKSCQQLQAEYATALAQAKGCNSILTVLQCTQKVDDELACPCPTFVNPSNTTALKTLSDLQAQWTKQGCQSGVICPAVLCPQPAAGQCAASSGSTGQCVDVKGTGT